MNSPSSANEPHAPYGEPSPDADPDIRGSLTAIRRAALRAREVARQTGTDLIVVRAGQVVRIKLQKADTRP